MTAIDRMQSLSQQDGSMVAALQFAMSLRERESVSRLSFSEGMSDPTFWVFLNTEDFGELENIFRIAQDIQSAHPSAEQFRLHVFPTSQVIEQALPPLTLLFARS